MSPKIKNLLLGAAAVVMLAVATYLFITNRNQEAEFPTHYNVHAVCLETGEEFPVTSKTEERAPFANPKTGRRTLYPWYFCYDCQYLFVPTPIFPIISPANPQNQNGRLRPKMATYANGRMIAIPRTRP